MPEFLKLLPPTEALARLMNDLPAPDPSAETIDSIDSLGRVLAQDVIAPHPLPEFPRSTVDGFAVRAKDTYGASDSLPAYLNLIGEVPMGASPKFKIEKTQTAIIHTGGMLPAGADAVVMLEYTQTVGGEIEILRAVADGENVLRVGEDVAQGQVVIVKGRVIRPPEIGGMMALGQIKVDVAKRPRVAILSSGDEVIDPKLNPQPGQVRDVNSYALAALIEQAGGEPVLYGILPDRLAVMQETAARALIECDVVVLTAGSSASARDLTSTAIDSLGKPGVLVHGVNVRPGKPTILAVCNGKPVIGLPGNPVSALVIAKLFVVPVIERLLGMQAKTLRPRVPAILTINIPSQAGREDWVAVRLVPETNREDRKVREEKYLAEPVFAKSNLIFSLSASDGLICVPADANGIGAGESVEVWLM